MVLIVIAFLATAVLFAAMLVLLEVGRRLGIRRLAADPEHSNEGLGAVDAAIYGLMGLLFAFTFSSAASRFDDRRVLINQETNDIGTAWLRLDLVPEDARPALRADLRDYTGARLTVTRAAYGDPVADAARADVAKLQARLWAGGVAACARVDNPATTTLLLGALNAMFDTATSRETARVRHQPTVIFALLVALALGSSLLIGHGMAKAKRCSRLHTIAFAAILAVVIYVIVDLEFPRAGLLRLDAADAPLISLHASMGP